MTIRKIRLTGRLVGLLALAVLLTLTIASPSRAQETPEPTPGDTPDETGPSVVVLPPLRVIPVGEEFVVEVLVEDVERLASFDLEMTYDPEQLSYQRAEELGAFLDSSERGDVTCDGPVVEGGSIAISCQTGGQPVCAGGASGASGSGLLGRLFFVGESARETPLELVTSSLVLDDVTPCGQDIGDEIAHGTENSTVLIIREGHTVQEEPALVKIAAPVEPIEVGEEFVVELLVEDVEHLGGFEFAIVYDPSLLSYQRLEDEGQVLAMSERKNTSCEDFTSTEGKVTAFCVTNYRPFCMGEPSGASGSGLLARVFFEAKSEGEAMLDLGDQTTLALDDVIPCDPNLNIPEIPFTRQDASVVLLGGGGGFPWLIVGPVIGVAALVLIGGGIAGLLRYRRQRGGGTAP